MAEKKFLVQIPILVWADYEEWAENEKQAIHIAKTRWENERDDKVLSRIVSDIEMATNHEPYVEILYDDEGLPIVR